MMTLRAMQAQAKKEGITLKVVPIYGKDRTGLMLDGRLPIYFPGGVEDVMTPKLLSSYIKAVKERPID